MLTPVLDIVHAPVEDGEPPAWCKERGWSEFLLSLGERELRACEELGLEAGLMSRMCRASCRRWWRRFVT